MTCCQHHMLHINLHTLYIHFIKLNLNLREFQESINYLKKLSSEQNWIFCLIILQFEFTFEFEYQTGFSGEFMIQYIPK